MRSDSPSRELAVLNADLAALSQLSLSFSENPCKTPFNMVVYVEQRQRGGL